MPDLDQILREAIETKNLSVVDKSRALKALATLKNTIGNLDIDLKPEELPKLEMAQIVSVPGDRARWVVFGTWDDGTYDIVREEGSFSRDVLVGWSPGDSVGTYHRKLDREFPKPKKVPAKKLDHGSSDEKNVVKFRRKQD